MKAKTNAPKKSRQPERNGNELQQHEKVRKERNRLRKELAEVKEERDYFRKLVCALMNEEIEFDKEEIMSRLGQGPSLLEILAEIESQGTK